MKTTHTTSMTARILIAAAFALGLAATALHAQESDAISANTGKSQGFFVYADYFQYKGAGAPGNLIAQESTYNLINFVDDPHVVSMTLPDVPSGNMVGTTLGYTWTDKAKNRHLIQGGYRSGNIDATISSVLWDDDSTSHALLRQDTKEYRLMYSFSPAKINFLTVGVEFVHSTNKGSFRQDYYDPYYDETEIVWDYGYKCDANDLLVHATLKAPDIQLFEGQSGGLWLLPRVDAGLGYSMRSASLRQDDELYGMNHFMISSIYSDSYTKDLLGKDAAVFETTLTVGLTYTVKSSRIILDLGYRYRTDLNNASKYGTDQKGIYARAGYSYNW